MPRTSLSPCHWELVDDSFGVGFFDSVPKSLRRLPTSKTTKRLSLLVQVEPKKAPFANPELDQEIPLSHWDHFSVYTGIQTPIHMYTYVYIYIHT